MELQNVLQQRRSIRKYKQQPVEKEKIEEMIQAAIYSESWKNSQTPRYHVIQSKEMLEQFKKKCLPEFNQKNIADAPVLIVTTFVKDRAGFQRNGSPDNELQNGWGVYDCGLANQNLILKATELGLGTLWIANTCFAYGKMNHVINAMGKLNRCRCEAPQKRSRKTLEEILEYR